MQQDMGFAHFLGQADGLGQFLLVVLAVMSVATWYLIVGKSIAQWRMRRRARAFLAEFWNATDMAEVAKHIDRQGVGDPFSHLTHHGLRAAEQYRNRSSYRLVEAGSADEFLTRALRRAMEQDTARLEYGLTVLASVASSAPFVGLFGTVWGIYHALLNIGMSGQGSLGQVAGPIGEALIMTALGLAVAIPAVLAYNAFARANRLLLAELDGFAHDLFAFMSTGIRAEGRNALPQTLARAA
ncbi:biopolymer transport protein ExbB [Sulfuritortus calidifontis]|uniref:Biopolymer transport protein ExbB n=1 Tax=Sulfuritortus calidifontis TaxID=1914471 RepID=A0A4R3JTQ0_9PROT|nr:MotA/TolQ/ExbB proton channel family protein [Sulfuritortus calidifontis]TCS70892.1 biopolymer transport protein ExbB [Sulfuritortus calidifontis]